MVQRSIVTEASIPVLAAGVRLHWDWARNRHVLLAPERVIALDNIAFEILSRCNGKKSTGTIAGELCTLYAADRKAILSDVTGMLQDLFDKRHLQEQAGNKNTRQRHVSPPPGTADREDFPLSVLAELTHRCPLQCPYCSNPLALERDELSTGAWKRVLDECAALGVLQIHFSGGEPMARKDLAALVAHAAGRGLYTNLITSGVLVTRQKLEALVHAGLDHVQISFQDARPEDADRIAHHPGGHVKKLEAAKLVREFDLPLTVNAVVHRQNLRNLPRTIEMAVALDASRLEVAHVQYLGWALMNRAALIPSEAQFEEAMRLVDDAREHLKGILVIDHVIPDYYAVRPKKCMGGWARQLLNITPSGLALPCHAAQSIPGLDFNSVREHSLAWIWKNSPAMRKFRGQEWMKEPCRTCEFREIDAGGCRCQAFALTGEAANADPACAKSSYHETLAALARAEAAADERQFAYRGFSTGPSPTT
ncbi:MAG TPA: pyrroloquinoline quinone biosynthesis protein PqqE [Rhizomicrobium sp.]|nr:pyrroloquinoline quinone biosynthesis protein PqqE [Rhizomicrobium sp.]